MDRHSPAVRTRTVRGIGLRRLGLSILFTYLRHKRGGSLKPLELFEVAYFGTLAVVGFLASDNLIVWLEKWSGDMSSLALAAFVFGSLLVRNPFTLPYAKETTPVEYWDSPVFLRVNRIVTLVWALAFTVSAAAGLYGDLVLDQPDNFWTGGSPRSGPCYSPSPSPSGIRTWRALKRPEHPASRRKLRLR